MTKATKGNKKSNTDFTPTEKMKVLLEATLSLEVKPTITAWCTLAKISRKTYYQWYKNPRFVQWFEKEREKQVMRFRPFLDQVGLMQAAKNYNYWRDMQMKIGGFIPKTAQDLDINDKRVLDLSGIPTEKLKELSKILSTIPSNKE